MVHYGVVVMSGNPEKYIILHKPNHPNSNSQHKVREHVYKAAKALGKAVPTGVHVHHVDKNPKNNLNTNLVVCTEAYHKLLHARSDAYDATGDANKMKCAYCHEYDDPQNMYVRPTQYQGWHLDCRSEKRRVKEPKTGPYKYGTTKASNPREQSVVGQLEAVHGKQLGATCGAAGCC